MGVNKLMYVSHIYYLEHHTTVFIFRLRVMRYTNILKIASGIQDGIC
jgi:hypothetical protein